MKEDFAAIAAQVRHDLCRHQVSEREHVIVDLLLRLSLDIGRPVARLPDKGFTAVTGISKGNVSTLLDGLVASRMISTSSKSSNESSNEYRVLPRGAHHEWLVRPRKAVADQERALAYLAAMQTVEQSELIPRDKSLSEAIADLAVETAAVAESRTGRFPNREPSQFPNREPVPESGTKPPPSIYEYSRSSVLEKRDLSFSSTRVSREPNGEDRHWLLGKLRRLTRLEAEIMRPQNDHQRRMGRLFWELEQKDVEWLKGALGDLVDRTDIPNKPAWFNRVMTSRLQEIHESRPGDRVAAPA